MKALNFFPKTAYAKKRKTAKKTFKDNEALSNHLLPVEVWQNILAYLTDPKDQKNIKLTCRKLYQYNFKQSAVISPSSQLISPQEYFITTNKKRVINFFFRPSHTAKKEESDYVFFSRMFCENVMSFSFISISEENQNLVAILLMIAFLASLILGAVGLCVLTGGPSIIGIIAGALAPTFIVVLAWTFLMAVGCFIAMAMDVTRYLIQLTIELTGFILGMFTAAILDVGDAIAAHLIENKMDKTFIEIEPGLAVIMTKQIDAEQKLLAELQKQKEKIERESDLERNRIYHDYSYDSYPRQNFNSTYWVTSAPFGSTHWPTSPIMGL